MEKAKPAIDGDGVLVSGENAKLSLGIAALFTWISWMNTYSVMPEGVPWQVMYLALALAFCCCALTVVMDRRRSVRDSGDAAREDGGGEDAGPERRGPLMGLNAGVLAACPLLLAVGRLLPGTEWLSLAAVLVGGFVLGFEYVRWACLVSRIAPLSAIGVVLGGAVVWSVAYAVLVSIPFEGSVVVAAGLPVIAFVSFRRTSPSMAEAPHVGAYRRLLSWQSAVKVWIVLFAVCLVVSTAVLGTSPLAGGRDFTQTLWSRMAIDIALCIGVMLWAGRTALDFSFSLLWRGIASLLVIALALGLVFPGSYGFVLFSYTAWNLLIPLVWITVCAAMRVVPFDRRLAAAAGLGAYALPYFLASVLYAPVSLWDGAVGIFAVSLVVLFFATCFVVESRDPELAYIFEGLRGRSLSVDEFETIDSRCADIATSKGLTPREQEVMALVCKGMSRTYIAEKLFISENTVKAHVSRVYAKLGVHSRGELQKYVGA